MVELHLDPSVVDLSVVVASLVVVVLVEEALVVEASLVVEAPVDMVTNLFSEWKMSSYLISPNIICYATYLFICMTRSIYTKN